MKILLNQYYLKRMDGAANLLLLFLSIFGTGVLIYKYGFYYEPAIAFILQSALLVVFSFLLLIYAYKIYRAGEIEYLKRKRYFIYLILAMTIVETLSFILTGSNFTLNNVISSLNAFLIIVVQVSILHQVIASAIKYNLRIAALKFRPAVIFVGTFVLLILTGALLLMLPRAVNPGEAISFTDALFTSTSACCVTGLTVVDTATRFSLLGKIVILILIQVGGFGMVVFGAFFAVILGKNLNLRSVAIIEDLLSDERISNIKSALQKILRATVIIEVTGALLLAIAWRNDFSSLKELLGFSIFHSISAFCNAGFSLFSENMTHPSAQNNVLLLYTLAVLIVLGGLGFGTVIEIFQKLTGKQKRLSRLSLQTRIVLTVTSVLIVGGFLAFFIIEKNSSFSNMTFWQRFNHSLFESVTLRTAGFNTFDYSMLLNPTIMLMIMLMFVGGSPGGTAGGIKTTTLAISFISIKSIISGEKRLTFMRRNLPYRSFNNAVIVLVFSITWVLLATLVLSFTEPQAEFLTVLFEEVSAFGTVGLSLNFTTTLSLSGKYVIVLSMLIGRLGPLTVALALSGRSKKVEFEYPEESVMVG